MAALDNPHWEDYAQARAAGLSQRNAYRKAYPRSKSWKDGTVDVKACNLEKEDKILVRYQELKDAAAFMAGGSVMTRIEKREILANMARDETLSAADRQRAIDLDNKMENEYTSKADASEQQARIDRIKAETARIKGENNDDISQDDGFMEALQGEVAEVWQQE